MSLLRGACLASQLALVGCGPHNSGAQGNEPDLNFTRVLWLSPELAPGSANVASAFAEFKLHNRGRQPVVIDGVRGKGGFAILRMDWHRVDSDTAAFITFEDPPEYERLAIAPGSSASLLLPLHVGGLSELNTSRWRACLRAVSDWTHPICSSARDYSELALPHAE
ncbi:MAG: hypothetical protein ACREO3_07995 [Arenimonas sp.]